METSEKNRLERLVKHIVYWILFFTAIVIFSGKEAMNKGFIFTDIPVTLFYVYFVGYYLIPFFVNRKMYALLGISFILVSLFISYIRLSGYNYFYYSVFVPVLEDADSKITFPLLILNAKDFSFGLFFFLAVKYTRSWLVYERESLQIENEQLESEIQLMRTQIDHHFMFNTLNNLYSLAVTEPSKVQFAIKKFWGIMDFVVNYADIREIRIDKELNLIKDYVELEKMRYGDRLDFNLKMDDSLKDYRIPPLILFPLIQNCFKYGSSLDPGNPWIRIEVEEKEDRISFMAKNSLNTVEFKQEEAEEISRTLSRIKKRLDFQLKNRYKLYATQNIREYSVTLDLFY